MTSNQLNISLRNRKIPKDKNKEDSPPLSDDLLKSEEYSSTEDTTPNAINSNSTESKYKFFHTPEMASALNLDQMLKVIPEFNGNSSDLHRFLKCCSIIYTPLKTNDDKALFMEYIPIKLIDRAYTMIKYAEFKTFEELKSKLQREFLETMSVEQLQNELININQLLNEDDRDYALRVERLLADLDDACCAGEPNNTHTALVRSLNARTALKAYQDGLRNPLKLLIKASRFASLKESIESAVNEGKNFTLNKNLHKSNTLNNPTSKSCTFCKRLGHTY